MEIELRQLQTVINRLFEHAMKTRGIEKIDLGAEAYWNIDSDQLYDLTKEPAELDVGSLSDNWEFASKLLDPHSQPIANQFTRLPRCCAVWVKCWERSSRRRDGSPYALSARSAYAAGFSRLTVTCKRLLRAALASEALISR